MRSEKSKPRERRAEPRRAVEGPVTLHPDGASPSSIKGGLLDIAGHGFRARHELRTLTPGTGVDYEIAGSRGRARVVWTRILEDHVESGFLILREHGR